jgi:hypothetical protein
VVSNLHIVKLSSFRAVEVSAWRGAVIRIEDNSLGR